MRMHIEKSDHLTTIGKRCAIRAFYLKVIYCPNAEIR